MSQFCRLVSIAAFIGVFCVLAQVAQGQQTNFFINPPEAGPPELFTSNPVLQIATEIEVKWSTDLERYSIALWQQSLGIGLATPGSILYS